MQGTQENVLAMSIVVILNWLIHNLATDWSLPPEVQSAFQSVITVALGAHLRWRQERKAAKGAAAAQRVLNAPDDPPPLPANDPPPQPLAKAA